MGRAITELKTQPNRLLLAILVLAFLLRAGLAVAIGDAVYDLDTGGTYDEISYDMLAQRVVGGHGFSYPTKWYPWVEPDEPTSYYSGTMVMSLALVYWLFGHHPLVARLLYAVMGTASCSLCYRLCRRFFSTRAALVAAGAFACYAYLILYGATLLTEGWFIFFILLSLNRLYACQDDPSIKNFCLLGVAAAGTLLFRTAVMPVLVCFLAWLFIETRRGQGLQDVWRFLIPVAIVAVAVSPWVIRNYVLFDRFMLTESQFGHVFWNGNHPDQGYTFDQVDWVAPIPEDVLELNEAERTYELLERGKANVLADPWRFVSLTVSRAATFFRFWPTSDTSLAGNVGRVFSFGIALPFMLYGIVVSVKQWRRLVPLYLFVLGLCAVYLVSWVMIRYRVPADAVMLVFAGVAVDDLLQRWQRRAGPGVAIATD